MNTARALDWIDQMDRTIAAMKGRPLSAKQRAGVLGVLLTLDPDSPFYSVCQFKPAASLPPHKEG